jgi:hypothetical protein
MADGSVAVYGGSISNLLGIYSGRINAESDLGMVWKVQVIKEILRAGVPGSVDLQVS